MRSRLHCRLLGTATLSALAAGLNASAGMDADPRAAGCLDVTRPPYSADPTGTHDATEAIQRAVNDARDQWMACFFPEGTYLISDTISCEQQVSKLPRPRRTDTKVQHYWDKPHRIVMIGSTRGKRPVLKLAPNAPGFDDPENPKRAVWIWAQTRDDAPGSEEPEWGKEQPNISFSHIFRGIDIISGDTRAPSGSGTAGRRDRHCRTVRSSQQVLTPG